MIKKTIILLGAFFVFLSLFAQDADMEQDLRFGFSLSPKVSWYSLKDQDQKDRDFYMAYSAYIDFYFEVNSRIQLHSALGLQSLEISKNDKSLLIFGCSFNGGAFDPALASYFKNETKSIFLGIPIQMKIKLVGKSGQLYSRLGIEYLLNLNTKGSRELYECGEPSGVGLTEATHSGNRNNGLLRFGLGYEWPMGKRNFFVEPLMTYGFSPVFQAGDNLAEFKVERGQWFQLGLSLGVLL